MTSGTLRNKLIELEATTRRAEPELRESIWNAGYADIVNPIEDDYMMDICCDANNKAEKNYYWNK